MTADHESNPKDSDVSDVTRIDRVCDRFEQAWREGRQPNVMDYLHDITEPLRSRLFDELLLSELECRARAGEPIDQAAYVSAFPDRRARIEMVFRRFENSGGDIKSPSRHAADTPSSFSAAGSNAAGRMCGNYRVVQEIARGGMGIVFKAYDTRLQRTVALKMILDRNLASAEAVQRFYAEAEMAAGLDHPGIVPVYDVGSYEGHHYYAMGLIEGPTLAQELEQRPYSFDEAAQLIMKLAGAVDHAHQHGVVHRDLKPSNILLGEDGQGRITDFGLAKRTDRPSQLTMDGQVLGTPGYMAPEQAAGQAEKAGPAVDIYALGAVLYHLLTGHPPFRASLDALVQILEQDPVPPRVLNRQVPRDLDVICMKCLNKNPAQRYATAEELADDLQRYLVGEPILARPLGPRRRVLRWARHRPRLASVLATMSAIYVYHLICYAMGNPGSHGLFHYLATGAVALVCSYAWVYQRLLLRPNAQAAILYAWAATDILVFSLFLIVAADGPHSPLIVLYLCMVAGSALTFDRHMVWLVTATSLLAYGFVVALSPWFHPKLPAASFRSITPVVISMLVIGLVQYFVLRCARAQRPQDRAFRATTKNILHSTIASQKQTAPADDTTQAPMGRQ